MTTLSIQVKLMKMLDSSPSLWILLGSIGSLSIMGWYLSTHLTNAQSIADGQQQLITQSNNSNRVPPPVRGRSKLDAPVGSTKINTTSTAKDPIKKIVGTWVNNNIDTKGITKLIVAKTGNRHSVHLFGKCDPTDCDLGKRLLRSSFWENSGSTHIEATYKESTVLRKLEIQSLQQFNSSPPAEIRVVFSNKFIDNSGRPSYSINETFQKIQSPNSRSNGQDSIPAK
jgi:hypothetical protein